MQIHGSGTSNFESTAIVDTSVDSQHGRLWSDALLTAKDPNGAYVNIQTTDSNNLRTADAENGLSISKGDVTNTTFIHKFGNAPDFDKADGIVTIWDGANDAGINEMQYTYSTTADIDSVISSNASDLQSVEIQGLDSLGSPLTQTITLAGSGYVGLGSSFLRVFRMKNTGSEDFIGDACTYVSGPTTAGVPDTTSDIRACVNDGNNQTLMAIYTIPSGTTGYLRSWYASLSGGKKTSNYIIDLVARPFNGVFQLKHRSSLAEDGTSAIQHEYAEPEVFNALTDIEMRVQATASITLAAISAGFDIVLVDN